MGLVCGLALSGLWHLGAAAAAADAACPSDIEAIRALQDGLPALRRDLRRHLAELRARARQQQRQQQPQQPLRGVLDWERCDWCETLCRLALPAGTRLLAVGPAGLPLADAPGAAGSVAVAVVAADGGQEVWGVGEASEDSFQIPQGVWASVAAASAGLAATADEAVVLVVPQGSSSCTRPRGFSATFMGAARWGLQEMLTHPVTQGLMRGINYVATNLYLASKHWPEDYVELEETRDNLRWLSWRFTELANMTDVDWKKSSVQDIVLQFCYGLQLAENNLSAIPDEQPFPVTARTTYVGVSPTDSLSMAGAAVPALGVHTADLAYEACFLLTSWAMEHAIPHLHLDGTEECEAAAGQALAQQAGTAGAGAGGGRLPFVSVVLGEGSRGREPEEVVRALRRRLRLPPGGPGPDLLVLPSDRASEREAFLRYAPVALKGQLGRQPKGGEEVHPWSAHEALERHAVGGLVQVTMGPSSRFPFAPIDDPHLGSIAAEVGRPVDVVLSRYLLQRGYGVLVDVVGSSQESTITHFEAILRMDFELNFAQMERIRALPTLLDAFAGQDPWNEFTPNRVVESPDVYALSDRPAPGRLAAAVDDEFHDALPEVLGAWRSLPCLRPERCPLEASRPAVGCLLKSFEEDPLGRARAAPGLRPPLQGKSDAATLDDLARQSLTRLPAALGDLPGEPAAHEFEEGGGLPAPKYAVVDDFLPEALAEALDAELPERGLCELLALCAEDRLSCVLDPANPREFMVFTGATPPTPAASAVKKLMHSDEVLAALRGLTGREVVVQAQGGYSEYQKLGYLSLHEDIGESTAGAGQRLPHIDRRLFRVNALLFLSDSSDEGHLELWRMHDATRTPRAPALRIAPRRNRLVIFQTYGGIHGVPWPMRGNRSRRVLLWYYMEAGHKPVVSIEFHSLPCADADACYADAAAA